MRRYAFKAFIEALLDECEVRGDEDVANVDKRVVPATAQDWDTEYLDSIISVKLIEGVEDAISHIASHGSGHTEAIIAKIHLPQKPISMVLIARLLCIMHQRNLPMVVNLAWGQKLALRQDASRTRPCRVRTTNNIQIPLRVAGKHAPDRNVQQAQTFYTRHDSRSFRRKF